MNVCQQKPTDFLQLMVNAYIDDSEADQVLVDERTGAVMRWSRKGKKTSHLAVHIILLLVVIRPTVGEQSTVMSMYVCLCVSFCGHLQKYQIFCTC